MIIARYLIKEIAQTLFGVALVLMLISLSGQVVGVFSEVTAGTLGIDVMLLVLGFKSLKILMIILPLSFYIAVLMSLSRLYQSNEMAAISASGVSQLYVVKVVLSFAAFFAILIGSFTLYIVPWAIGEEQDITFESENSSEIEGMVAGRFREMLNGVMYVEKMNDERTEMQGVFLQQSLKHNKELIIRAEKGENKMNSQTGDQFMVFGNGVRYQRVKSKLNHTVIEFEEHGVRIREKSSKVQKRKHAAISTIELIKKNGASYKAELHSRLAPVILCLLLAVLAVPLSQTSPRHGQYLRLGLGLLIYVGVTNLISIGITWIIQGKVSPGFGLWWIHILMLFVVVFLLMQQQGFRYLYSKMQNK